jgi:prepilin-type N-terminal cleavage/methylation domain-containing protein
MAFFQRRRFSTRFAVAAQRGFSLVELSIVVAIISVVATLGLEAAANFVVRTSSNVSSERLKVIDAATASFFKIYGRLPCPALRSAAPSSSAYGLENCSLAMSSGTTVGGGLLAGAVPFRSLNLPISFALDGFGSKLAYIVTKNLTVAGGNATAINAFGSTGGSTDTNGVAAIEVRTGVLEQPCSTSKCQILASPAANTGAAYFIISHGADQRGAVSARGTALKTCIIFPTERRVDTQNCVFGDSVATVRSNMSVTTIPFNVFYDNRLNAGLNLTSYFDDAVIWRTKAQL